MNARLVKVFELLGIGWYIAVTIVIGLAFGLWLDGVAGSSPLFTLVGLFFGLLVALVGAYRMVVRATAKED